jgi:hypothetical protein
MQCLFRCELQRQIGWKDSGLGIYPATDFFSFMFPMCNLRSPGRRYSGAFASLSCCPHELPS